jgi:acetyltransferase-like isoleucine patch superfamily enzyme
MLSNHNYKDDSEQLLISGGTIASNNAQAYNLPDASVVTKKILVQLKNSFNAIEFTDFLSQIAGSEIDESVAVFPPLYINYGKHTSIGKNVFVMFDCVFLDLGAITTDDNVLIAPKVSLLSEGHPVSPNGRGSHILGHILIRKNALTGMRKP